MLFRVLIQTHQLFVGGDGVSRHSQDELLIPCPHHLSRAYLSKNSRVMRRIPNSPGSYSRLVGIGCLLCRMQQARKALEHASFQQTVPVSTPDVMLDVRRTPPSQPLQKRRSRGSGILVFGFVMILIAGIVGFYVSTSRVADSRARIATPIAVIKTAPAEIPYPTYLPDGDNTHPVYFHVCIGRTPRFKDFAYEVKIERYNQSNIDGETFSIHHTGFGSNQCYRISGAGAQI